MTQQEGQDKRKRRRFTSDGCQVEGCTVPLLLSYHRKYHICGDHFKAPCVAIDGENLRFCQKCGRFQPLSDFQGIKRTCQRALDSHNARRRQREEAKRSATSPSGEGGAPSAQHPQREDRQRGEAQQSSGQEVSTDSASREGSSPRDVGGSSARARSGTTGVTSLSHETEQGAAMAAQGGQQGPPAPSSPPQPLPQPAGPQELPMPPPPQLAQHQAGAAWQQQPGQQGGWQQQSLASWARQEPSSRQGPLDDGKMMAQHGSGSLQSGGGQTQPSSNMNPTASQQAQPSSRPYAAAQHLGGIAPHGSGYLPFNGGLLPHPLDSLAHIQTAHQPAGWPASMPELALQPQLWGSGNGPQLAASMPILHLASGGAGAMPGLAAAAMPMPHPAACLGGAGVRPPMLASYAAALAGAELAGSVEDLMGDLPELKAEGLPVISPLLGCLLGWSEVGTWDAPSAADSAQRAANAPGQPPPPGRTPAPVHNGPTAATLVSAGVPPQAASAVVALPGEEYISPARLHRMSLKIFGCTPDQLGAGIRAELQAVLQEGAGLVESSIRPGCTHVTANLHMGHSGGNPLRAAPEAELLQRLLSPRTLGVAANNPVLLQWQGRLAATRGGGAPLGTMAVPEARLQVCPACVLAPSPGRPWPLVQVQLGATGAPPAAAAASSVLEGSLIASLQGSTVLCRQAGRHLPVEVWGTTAAAAAAALSCAPVLSEPPFEGSGPGSGSDAGGGSDSELTSSTSSRSVLLRGASIKSSDSEQEAAGAAALPELAAAVMAAAAVGSSDACLPAALSLWVRPVGLRPGCCELEMQLQLPCGLPGAAAGEGPRAVLLSRPAPLLVMRDAAAAREVQALVQASGRIGAECFDDLLRDVGVAVAFLEQQQQQPADAVEPPIPPGFAAAAAHAAAECAHRRGMPALAALLRRALAAARAAVAAAAAAESPAESEALEDDSCTACSKAKLLAAGIKQAVKQRQPFAGKAAPGAEARALGLLGARFDTRSSAAVKAEAMLAEHGGGIAQPTSLPCDALLRLCALLAAIFAGVMAHRLALQAAAA